MANENQNMAMPLQNEMQLANWISNMFSNKTANPNYTGATVQAPQLVNQMGAQDMQNLMTEFMRGNGQFLQNMQQQNQSGLYNSNTRQLVANDIMSQAALKASQANVPIQQGNAQLMNSYYAKLGAQQPKYLPNRNQGAALGGLAIAGLSKLLGGSAEELLGGKKKGGGKGDNSSGTTSPSSGSNDPLTAVAEAFSGSFGELIPNDFGMDVSPIQSESMGEAVSFDAGSAMSGIDLGGVTDTLSNLSLPDFKLPELDFGDFDFGDFDILDIGSWFD